MNIVNRLPELIKAKQEQIKAVAERDISEVEIAVGIGINPATLSRYKNGKVESVNFDVLQKLCNYFGVPSEQIFRVVPEKETA